jgi:ribosome-interacting GTPase 1
MPTNLPPDYANAEKRFREAQTPVEKVACLEEMISIVPKHKGTDKLRADLRRQLSRLKDEAQAARKKQGGHASAFHIEREGAGQAMLMGAANTGKSALLRALTNAEPEVSPAPFSTWKPTPGMMPYQDVLIQLVDTPPLDGEYVEPALFDLARRTDVVLLVVDLHADPLQQLEVSLRVLEAHRLAPLQHQEGWSGDPRTVFRPFIVLVNKCDDESMDEVYELFCELCRDLRGGDCQHLPLSALNGRYVDLFKQVLYERLGILRVYAKPPGKEPDLERPFVLKQCSTVLDLAGIVHRDIAENLKAARVWGSSAFDGQMVTRDYVLQEGDIVELRA